MDYLFIVLVIIGLSAQSITKKSFSAKCNAPFIFSFVSVFVAALFFAVSAGKNFIFSWDYVPYAVLFGLGYGASVIFSFFAINEGSLALTSLVTSYSLLIPTAYGMVFLGEEPGFMLIIGILLLMVSLLLINYEKGEKKITFKWIIYVLLSFFGNGMCTTVQKVQQLNQNKAYKNEFMTLALLLVSVVCLIFSLIKHRSQMKVCIKPITVLPLICGIANAIVNYLVMVLSRLPASLVFPLISAGGIITTGIVSLLVYRERFTKQQIIGMILGIASVVCLNI